MRLSSTLILVELLLALAPSGLRAQDLGPYAGYEYGLPLSFERAPGIVNTYAFDGTGTSANHTLTFGAALDVPEFAGPRIDACAHLGLALSNGHFTSASFPIVDTLTLPPLTSRDFELSSSLTVLQADISGRVRVAETISLFAGPWISYRLSSAFFQTERIVGPDTGTYRNGARERVVAAGAGLGSAALRGGIAFGLGVRSRLADGPALGLDLYGRVDAGSLAEGLGARAWSAGATVSMLMPMNTRPATAETLAVAPSPPPPSAPRLKASVQLVPAGSGPAMLTSHATVHRVRARLDIPIAFAPGAAEIPRAMELDRGAAGAFSERDLLRKSPREIFEARLSAIASRLRATSGSRIVLTGSRSSRELAGLAHERAAAVERYLVRTWGIDSARIATGAAQGVGSATVSVRTEPSDLLEPLEIEWIERTFIAPRVSLHKSITADAGLRGVSMTIRQRDRVVASYRQGDDSTLRIAMSVERPVQPLVAELVAEDSTGAIAIARDTLRVSEPAPAEPDAEILSWILSADGSARGRHLVDSIMPQVRTSAAVDVRPLCATRGDAALVVGRLLLNELSAKGTEPKSMNIVGESGDGGCYEDGVVVVTVTQEVGESAVGR